VNPLPNQAYRELLASPLSLAANLLLVDPSGLGGIHCKARVSPWRSAFMQQFSRAAAGLGPVIALAPHADERSLIGGVDWVASLQAGQSRFEAGVLGRVNKGILQIGMAERLQPAIAGLIAQAMDQPALQGTMPAAIAAPSAGTASSFACLLLDESLAEEAAAPGLLCCRLAFWITEAQWFDKPVHFLDSAVLERARKLLKQTAASPDVFQALSESALAFGVEDLRAPQFALRAFRALKALVLSLDRQVPEEDEVIAAVAAIVYGPRATRLPSASEVQSQGQDKPQPRQPADQETVAEELSAGDRHQSPAHLNHAQGEHQAASGKNDASAYQPVSHHHDVSEVQAPVSTSQVLAMTVAAAQALLPAGLLAAAALAATARSGASSVAGRSMTRSKAGLRGRSLGVREGSPGQRSRLHVLATIRAAVPWQGLRERPSQDAPLRIERSDLRVHRYEQRDQLTTVFVVDASGSAALHRLAEVKGAVALLLAQCYVRRDQVAVIAFRLDQAQLLLPPTRSLTRAKRQLVALPGGGGTPLASALALTAKLMVTWHRQGQQCQTIVLSDGKANIDLDGKPGRAKAMQDAHHQARLLARLRLAGSRLVWVDTAPRPSGEAQTMAEAMRASYCLLPYANAKGLAALAS
jgi:magnesium chelatase subunit D